MPTKRRAANGAAPSFAEAQLVALGSKMQDIAFRDPKLEPVMMHLAKTCGLTAVVKELDKMRKYNKRRAKG